MIEETDILTLRMELAKGRMQEIVETEVRYWTYLFDYETIQEDFASIIKIWYSAIENC